MVERSVRPNKRHGQAELLRRDHRLVLLPIAVLLVATALLSLAGHPVGTHPSVEAFSGTAEGAARVKVLASWLLLSGLGIAVAAHFFIHLRELGRRTQRELAITYAALAILGAGSVALGHPEEAHRFVGEQFVCRAFATLEAGQEPPAPPPAAQNQANQQAAAAKPAPIAFLRESSWAGSKSLNCPEAEKWHLMRLLNGAQRLLLAFITPALVLGMILSLAAGTGLDFKRQAERLNTYLYLASAVLVAGLLFLSALLRWPGFALPQGARAQFEAHAGAITLYWGVAYSLFNAAIYLPVAARLRARRVEAPMPAPIAPSSDDGAGRATAAAPTAPAAPTSDPLLTPVGMLKVGASMFAPALAGLLAGILAI